MTVMIGYMLQGTVITLEIFFLTLLFALPLALPVTFGRMSKNFILSGIIKFYLLIMRGTPLILQLIFVYFAPKYLFQFMNLALGDYITSPYFWNVIRAMLSYDRFTATIVAFSLNYAAYFAEIYRGGIESISQGQYEAAKVLGFTRSQTFTRIIMPQMIKRILPAIGNETITLVKDTALSQTIGVLELFHMARTASAREFSTMPIFVAGVFYLVMNWLVTITYAKFEKKLSYYS